MKSSYYIVLFVLFVSLYSCVNSRNDVYKQYPKGKEFDFNILKAAKQLYLYKDWKICLINISKDWDSFDPHLLFFNKKNKLTAACYYASNLIDTIVNDTICGNLNKSRVSRLPWYRNDLPPGFCLKYLESNNAETLTICNKLIDTLVFENNMVLLHYHYSKNKFIGLQQQSTLKKVIFSKKFEYFDSLKFDLSDYLLDYDNCEIILIEQSENKGIIRDKMIISDTIKFKSFYHQMFKEISNKCTR